MRNWTLTVALICLFVLGFSVGWLAKPEKILVSYLTYESDGGSDIFTRGPYLTTPTLGTPESAMPGYQAIKGIYFNEMTKKLIAVDTLGRRIEIEAKDIFIKASK